MTQQTNNSNELNPQKWIEKAGEDEQVCRLLLKHQDIPPSVICFSAQQMSEKYLKALLVYNTKDYPRIHDLKRLATLLETFVSDIFSLEEDLNILNKFYSTTRYPGDFPEGFSLKDANEAFDAALKIKDFVLSKLQK